MAAQEDHDLVARPGYLGEALKFALDVRPRRPVRRAAEHLTKNHDILFCEAKSLDEQIAHQQDVVAWPLKLERFRQVGVFRASSEQREFTGTGSFGRFRDRGQHR